MNDFILYSITSLRNKKVYVGVTANYRHRVVTHLGYLRRNKHKNKHLQFVFNKNGESSLVFDIIDTYSNREDCYRAEKFLTDCVLRMDDRICMNGVSGGLDITDKARAAYHEKIKSDPSQMEALRQRSSKINKGRKWSEEYKGKMSLALKGRVFSEQHKDRIRKAHIGGKANGAKKVIDISTGHVFDCIKDAAKHLNIKYCTLQSYLSGKNRNKTNIRWLFHTIENNSSSGSGSTLTTGFPTTHTPPATMK